MQYVRSIGGSVSKTWNSINPATLSGAIDVIVVEQEDGTVRQDMAVFMKLKTM
jgi:phosphatidate phosphatase LPIN